MPNQAFVCRCELPIHDIKFVALTGRRLHWQWQRR